MSKIAIVIKGVSGSGKSTFARTLASMNSSHVICEADSYFVDKDGNYNFDASKLGAAHHYCKTKFEAALAANTQLVICANTNTQQRDYKFYLDKAKEYGYTTHVVVVERHLNTTSIHNVPQETLDRQVANLRNSIQL
jgi:uridine kinase